MEAALAVAKGFIRCRQAGFPGDRGSWQVSVEMAVIMEDVADLLERPRRRHPRGMIGSGEPECAGSNAARKVSFFPCKRLPVQPPRNIFAGRAPLVAEVHAQEYRALALGG